MQIELTDQNIGDMIRSIEQYRNCIEGHYSFVVSAESLYAILTKGYSDED